MTPGAKTLALMSPHTRMWHQCLNWSPSCSDTTAACPHRGWSDLFNCGSCLLTLHPDPVSVFSPLRCHVLPAPFPALHRLQQLPPLQHSPGSEQCRWTLCLDALKALSSLPWVLSVLTETFFLLLMFFKTVSLHSLSHYHDLYFSLTIIIMRDISYLMCLCIYYLFSSSSLQVPLEFGLD